MTRAAWWQKDAHAERRPFLVQRQKIRRVLSDWFTTEGFMEVECAALQVSPGNETHLHAFSTAYLSEDGQARELYLHTSPELSCKKLLAAGEDKIFDIEGII